MGIFDNWKAANGGESAPIQQIANVEFVLKAMDSNLPAPLYMHLIRGSRGYSSSYHGVFFNCQLLVPMGNPITDLTSLLAALDSLPGSSSKIAQCVGTVQVASNTNWFSGLFPAFRLNRQSPSSMYVEYYLYNSIISNSYYVSINTSDLTALSLNDTVYRIV